MLENDSASICSFNSPRLSRGKNKLIFRIDRVKQRLCVSKMRNEVNRTSTTFPVQEHPIHRTGRCQEWMSAVREFGNHDTCGTIPLSFKFVMLRFIPLFLSTKAKRRPMYQRKFPSVVSYHFRNRTTIIVISLLGSIDVVEQRQEDDPTFKFFRPCFTN